MTNSKDGRNAFKVGGYPFQSKSPQHGKQASLCKHTPITLSPPCPCQSMPRGRAKPALKFNPAGKAKFSSKPAVLPTPALPTTLPGSSAPSTSSTPSIGILDDVRSRDMHRIQHGDNAPDLVANADSGFRLAHSMSRMHLNAAPALSTSSSNHQEHPATDNTESQHSDFNARSSSYQPDHDSFSTPFDGDDGRLSSWSSDSDDSDDTQRSPSPTEVNLLVPIVCHSSDICWLFDSPSHHPNQLKKLCLPLQRTSLGMDCSNGSTLHTCSNMKHQ